MKIQENLGTIDRVLRIVAGVILLLLVPLVLIGPEYEWANIGFLGVFPVVAGLIGYCPPYALLGIDTFKGSKAQKTEADPKHNRLACC